MANSPNENVNVWNSQKNESSISDAQKLFVTEKLESNMKFFDWLKVEEIFSEFRKFLNSKSKYRDLALKISSFNDEQKNSLDEQIKQEKLKVLFLRKKNLKDLENIFRREYDSLNISKVSQKLSSLSIIDLSSLIKSDAKRRNFLKENKFFSSEQKLLDSRKIDEKNILENIKITKSSLKKLDEGSRTRLFYIFNNYSKINFSDIESIIQALSDKKSKINLLKYFVSKISVADLEKNNLLNSTRKDKLIKSISNTLWINENEAKNIYSSLDRNQVFLDVDDLENSDLEWLLDDNAFKKMIIDEYNSDLEDAWFSEKSSLNLVPDSKWNLHNSFISFVINDSNISPEIRANIWKLQKWNYIEISKWDKKWYYFVKEVDKWKSTSSKVLVLENITANGWVKRLGTWNNESFTYENFYKLLEKTSLSNGNSKITFFDAESFKSRWIEEKIDSSEEIESYEDLIKWLDDIDSEGKNFWLSENETVILDAESGFVFLIEKIDKWRKQIVINQWWNWNKKFSFREFYSAMKSSGKKLKRDKKINSFSELISSLSSYKSFSWLELKNWKIYDKNSKDKAPITSFLWIWKWLVIDDISENDVNYVIWDLKENKKWKKELIKWQKTNNFSQLFQDIKLNDLSFDSSLDKEINNAPKTKWSLFKKIMSWLSIAEIIGSFEIVVDWIKKRLQRWNRLKSLKLAQKLGWVLGKEMELYLKSIAEQEEKWLIEEISEHLKKLDSWDMIKQVLEIVKNRDSEQYEIIAAMMAVTKYGNLYPKWLKDYAWSFMWYKLLWGTETIKKDFEKTFNWNLKPWDKEYRNFTEEELMIYYLKQLWIKWKVRWKLWKDFASALNNWTSEEYESWANQTWNHNTFLARYNEFEWFLKAREYAWAIWALEKVLWKNGNAVNMNKAPFVLAISWYWKYLNSTLVKKLQVLSLKTPYSSIWFSQSENHSNRYKNLIRDIIKNWYPDDKKMLSDYENMLNLKWWYSGDIVVSAWKFWDIYWEKIAKHLSFNSSMIFDKKSKVSSFKDFYDTSEWVFTDGSYSIPDEDFADWVLNNNNLTSFWVWLSKISSDATWGFWREPSKDYYMMYLKHLEEIKSYPASEEEKKAIFMKTFWPLEQRIRDLSWFWANKPGQDLTDSPITDELYKRGLSIAKKWEREWIDYEKFLERNFYNFINRPTLSVWDTLKSTKLSINDLLFN